LIFRHPPTEWAVSGFRNSGAALLFSQQKNVFRDTISRVWRSFRNVFTLTITMDAATAARIDRILDLLEGKQQREVDALAARLKAINDELYAAVAAANQNQS
jgi:hypothetical protein